MPKDNCTINIMELRSAFGTGGGPEKTILLTPYYLDPKVYHVIIVYLRDLRPLSVSHKEKHSECSYYEIVEKSRISFKTYKELKDIIQREKIDIIHGHDYKSNFWALLLAKIYKLHLITTLHLWTDENLKERFYAWFDRRMLRFFEHVIAVSMPLYQEALSYGVKEERLTLIHNAIDVERFKLHHEKVVDNKEVVNLGYLGRIAPMKNLSMLLRSAYELKKLDIKFKLEIVGEGPQRTLLESLAKELELVDIITWTDYMADVRPFYERIDIFVLPSNKEGLPNVLLEAMAYSLPCIATTVGANPDLIEDHISGILISPGDQDALVRYLKRLIESPEERDLIGKNARIRIEEHFTLERRFEKFEQIINKIFMEKS